MPPKSSPPAGKRSRTGCLTCRERKLKCDEKKPICSHCKKAGRQCQPSSGIVFRHHQNPSINATLAGEHDDDLGSFYAYRDTFTKENIWLPTAPKLRFITVTDPYAEDEFTLDLEHLDHHSPDGTIISVTNICPRSNTPATQFHPPSASASLSFNDLRDEPFVATPASAPTSMHRPTPAQNKSLPNVPTFDRTVRRSLSSFAPSISSPASTIPTRTLPSPLSPFSVAPPPVNQQNTNSFQDSQFRLPSFSQTSSPQLWGMTSRTFQFNQPRYIPPDAHVHVETDQEVLFLLRHYTTVVGLGMDLFDCGRFFSDYIPTRALKDPLLRNACCAYAAKQLAMVNGMKLGISGLHSRPARTEYWHSAQPGDYKEIAEKYYRDAIHLLLSAVNLVTTDRHAPESWQDDIAKAAKSDDLMAATAILCEYEAIDSAGEAWQRHLSGTKSLLDIAEAGMKPLDHIEISQRKPRFSRARRAIFWNFARQDFAAALITESPARLDVNNHQLWRDAGLELDATGRLIPNQGTWIEYSEGGLAMREDMIANGLLLILSKICNYLSNAESLTPQPPGVSARNQSQISAGVPYYGLSQQILSQRWTLLADEVEAWRSNLPDTFRPIGRSQSTNGIFDEIWYGVGMCAAAVANYHMARILLLINKPQESTMTRSTVSSRMGEYRSIVPECEWHSREIVGIALARPDVAVRIFLILPLFFAGQCFTELEERKIVVEVLRSIEKELGWATEYRVQALMKQWGYDETTLYQGEFRAPSELRI